MAFKRWILNKLNVYAELPDGNQAMEAHIVALRKMVGTDVHRALFDHLYETLTVLDAKASALLTFNSIIFAVVAIFASRLGTEDPLSLTILGAGLVLLVVSTLILLRIIWVHWSTTDDLMDMDGHILTLLKVRLKRTVSYRLAWLLVIAAIPFMFAAFLKSAIEP